jgi:hypothetical protein
MRRPTVMPDLGRVRRLLRRWADRSGPLGLIGAAILATCVGYYAGSIDPQRQHLESLRAEADIASSASTRPARQPVGDAGTRLQQFAAGFPQERELAALLGQLYAIGERESVRLSQAEYRFVEPDVLGMVQYKIQLPVVASYPALRRFVAAALSELPSLAVTQINLQRERIGQGQLDARLELTLYLRAGRVPTAGSQPGPADVSRAPQVALPGADR